MHRADRARRQVNEAQLANSRRRAGSGTRLLNNASVEPLITLMSEHGVSRLEPSQRGWSLASARDFRIHVRPRRSPPSWMRCSIAATSSTNKAHRSTRTTQRSTTGGGTAPASWRSAWSANPQRALRANIGQLEAGLSPQRPSTAAPRRRIAVAPDVRDADHQHESARRPTPRAFPLAHTVSTYERLRTARVHTPSY